MQSVKLKRKMIKTNKPGKKKGTPKTGGRKPGSTNLIGKELKELINNYCVSNWYKFMDTLPVLNELEYCKTYLQLLEYCIPKLQRTTIQRESEPEEFKEKLSPEERRIMIDKLRREINSI